MKDLQWAELRETVILQQSVFVTVFLQKNQDSTDEVRQFKGFLVSVQHPNGTLLGTMNVTGASPPEAGVGEACVGTSLSHTDATPKDYVVFQWIAPANLDPAVDVIVRYVKDILIYRIPKQYNKGPDMELSIISLLSLRFGSYVKIKTIWLSPFCSC